MPTSKPRRRRTAEDARAAILDAAERRLAAAGPDGIRLQDVAADVGVSHPTVLHHFGSREALLEAVRERAYRSFHDDVLAAVATTEAGARSIASLLERVYAALDGKGRARAFAWLSLAGTAPPAGALGMHDLAAAVHEIRRARRKAAGKPAPSAEETLHVVLMAGYTMFAEAILEPPLRASGALSDDPRAGKRFRGFVAKVVASLLDAEG